MPEQPPAWLVWLAIICIGIPIILLFIGMIWPMIEHLVAVRREAKEERRNKAEKFTPTHRRTWERD